MMAPMPWIKRTFPFHAEPGQFPMLVERLRGTPARVEEMMARIPSELYTRPVGDGWTIQEEVGHLIDVEQLFDYRLTQFIKSETELMAPKLDGSYTSKQKYNDQPMADILAKLRNVRMAHVARLETVDDDVIARVSHHVRLDKDVRLVDMVEFAAEHDDNHLAVIVSKWRKLAG